MLKRDIRFF